MKPNFALSLSFDGIRLLHRAAGGWRIVGDVALDAADLGAELTRLRGAAAALEPGDITTKVLLPDAQIKYLTIETPDMDDAARLETARGALDGATPYAVSDLAFDISADGPRTHVAAVARETLAEAEAFAVEHQFNPVSFAAIPGDKPYLGEPFFGPTTMAADLLSDSETVEPDGIAVVVIGDVIAPEIPAEVDKTPAVSPDLAPAAKDIAEPETAADPMPQDVSPPVKTDVPESGGAPAPVVAPDTVAEPEKPPEKSAQKASDEQAPDATHTTPAPAPAISQAPAPPPTDIANKSAPLDSAPTAKNIPSLAPLRAARTTEAQVPKVPAPQAAGFASRRKAATPPLAGARREPTVSAPLPPIEAGVADQAIRPDSSSLDAPPPPALADDPDPTPAAAPKAGFLSRRKKAAAAPLPNAKPVEAKPAPSRARAAASEAERMTVFGARKVDVGGKPRFLGLILTAALLVFLAGVAAWASVFLDDGLGLSRLFVPRSEPEIAAVPDTPNPTRTSAETGDPVQAAALDPGLTEEDGAVLDALREPVARPVEPDLSEAELEAKYAATGIWPRAPVVPPAPVDLIGIDDLYLTSIDPISTAADAIALPAPDSLLTDAAFDSVPNPIAPGAQFALDDRGLVIPTSAGTMNPDGVIVYLGKPAVVPPATLARFQPPAEAPPVLDRVAGLRPKTRPGGLVENAERALFDGLTRRELAGYRPSLRPASIQEQAEAAAAPPPVETAPAVTPQDTAEAVAAALATPPRNTAFDTATRFAVVASLRPDTRPRNFDRIVKRAERAAPQRETRVASAAAVAPRTVSPKIPSKASVARQATVKNAINLRKVNLIGVYGKPSNRRALVRMGNGRYKKVVVGDRIDGGRVSAIGDGELRYTKGGRAVVLKMPKG